MTVTCTYFSGVLALYITRGDLDRLWTEGKLETVLALHGESIGDGAYTLVADPPARESLRSVVSLEREIMVRLARSAERKDQLERAKRRGKKASHAAE